MKAISKLLVLFSIATILVGCGSGRTRNEKVSAMINKIDSPFMVASLTPQNIIDKSGATKDGVLPYTYKTLSTFFLDANETGVDNNTKLQMIAGEGSGLGPDVYGFFKVQDEIKFQDMIEKEMNGKIKEKDGFKYFIKEKENYALVWNEEFAVISNIPFDLAALFSGGGGDEGEKTVKRCMNIITAGEEGEMNSDYTDFLAKEADVSTYFESTGFLDFLAGFGTIKKKEVAEYKENYGGNTIQSFLNFENGKITWKHEFNIMPDFLKEFDFVEEKGVSENLFKYGLSENPLFKMGVNVGTEQILDYMESSMDDNEFKSFIQDLEDKGFSRADLIETFSGELLVILDHVTIEKQMIDYGYGEPFAEMKPNPVLGVAIGIKDKTAFSQLNENVEVSPNGIIELENQLFGTVTNDVFFVSTDTAWLNQILQGKTVEIKSNNDLLTSEPFGFYLDVENDNKSNFETLDMPISEILMNAYGYINLSSAEFTIELKDKSQNALLVITKSISDKIVEEEEALNQDMKNIIDQEILEGLDENIEEVTEQVVEEVEEVFENNEAEINKSLDGLFKELEKGVDQISNGNK